MMSRFDRGAAVVCTVPRMMPDNYSAIEQARTLSAIRIDRAAVADCLND
jgi:hypothetical protein